MTLREILEHHLYYESPNPDDSFWHCEPEPLIADLVALIRAERRAERERGYREGIAAMHSQIEEAYDNGEIGDGSRKQLLKRIAQQRIRALLDADPEASA